MTVDELEPLVAALLADHRVHDLVAAVLHDLLAQDHVAFVDDLRQPREPGPLHRWYGPDGLVVSLPRGLMCQYPGCGVPIRPHDARRDDHGVRIICARGHDYLRIEISGSAS